MKQVERIVSCIEQETILLSLHMCDYNINLYVELNQDTVYCLSAIGCVSR